MKDINKLINHLTGLQEAILKQLLVSIEPGAATDITITDIAEAVYTKPIEVRKTLKILILIELLEYEVLNGRGVSIKIIDKDTFDRLKTHFDL